MRNMRGKPFKKGMTPWNKGLKGLKIGTKKGAIFNQRHKDNLRKAKLGKLGSRANNWKGGKTSLGKQIKSNDYFKRWRLSVFERDNWTCQGCGKRGGIELHPHHIKRFSIILKENNIKSVKDGLKCKELWDINNGVTLCRGCHGLIHPNIIQADKKHSV